jgi:hypothetical protein
MPTGEEDTMPTNERIHDTMEKMKRGRPATGRCERVTVRVTPEMAEKLAKRGQRERRRTLADTARAIIEEVLEKEEG